MPRPTLRWDYSTIGGTWIGSLPAHVSSAIHDSLAAFDRALVDSFIKSCGYHSSWHSFRAEQAAQSPTDREKRVAAAKISEMADDLAATLPEMGGTKPDYQDLRLSTGRQVAFLDDLKYHLEELAEDMRDVDRALSSAPEDRVARPKSRDDLAANLAREYQERLKTKPTVWAETVYERASPFVNVLKIMLDYCEGRNHSIDAIKNIALRAASEMDT